MSSWRDQILKEFVPQVARLTLVADPDGLLLEEELLRGLRERGFELIPFEDHVTFRYAYESKYRSRWDRGELTDLVVVLRAGLDNLSSLPYDLLQAGRKLFFSLGELFPSLSYPVVAALDRACLDALHNALLQQKPGDLGDSATKDFALRHVFEIAPELIRQPSDLLRVLLRRHYRGERVPDILDERFIQLLRKSNVFAEWPLEQIVRDRAEFFEFLQERWPIYLDRVANVSVSTVREMDAAYDLRFSGPSDIPFDHDDVRVYIDNLFLEGILNPIAHRNAEALATKWVASGLILDPQTDILRRLEGLIESLENSVPASEARHSDWLSFGRRWAELTVMSCQASTIASRDVQQRIEKLEDTVNRAFLEWVQGRYAGLYNQPPTPPVMLHHIPLFLARQLLGPTRAKGALVLLDGLALDQWIVIRDVLAKQRQDLRLREEAVFSWVPTLTSVSRQAAFAAKAPLYFPSTIRSTDKEGSLWTRFWVDQGLAQEEVGYARGLDGSDLSTVEDILSHPKVHVVGLVIDKVDKIMHGMELGTAGMHNQVRQWTTQGFMVDLIDLLCDGGFRVFITSDHGNTEAQGCGRPEEGVLAETRGQRCRIYTDQVLRAKAKERFPEAIEWPTLGLPDDFLPLLAPSGRAFVPEGEHLVGHGGVSLGELVVPLIEVERRSR